MSRRQDQELMEEAFAQARAWLSVECPDVDLNDLPGSPEAFDAGVWFGMAATVNVLGQHGYLKRRRLPK